jgi:lipoprotein-anchoring transpeptidase ErfK/SrfK
MDLLRDGQAAARAGRPKAARYYLELAARLDPLNEETLLWLAALAESPEETRVLLQQVLAINPGNRRALAGMAAVEREIGKRVSAEGVTDTGAEARLSGLARGPSPQELRDGVGGEAPARLDDHLPDGAALSGKAVVEEAPAPQARTRGSRSRKASVFRLILIVLILAAIAGIILFVLLTTGVVPAGATPGQFPSPEGKAVQVLSVAATPGASVRLPMRRRAAIRVGTPTEEERLAAMLGRLVEPWERGDWPRVWQITQESPVRDLPIAQEKAFAAQMNWGLSLVALGRVEEAVPHFSSAREIYPEDVRAIGELEKAQNYLTGRKAFLAGDWPTAIRALRRVFAVDASYLNVRHLLAEAYWRKGQAAEAKGRLAEAAATYRHALAAEPGRQETRTSLDHVIRLLTPPTPTPTVTPTPGPEKWIEVDLSEQRLRAHEGNKVVLDVLVSTGLPRTPTVTGTFHIWSKLLKTDMVGGDPALGNYYNLKGVPYVMYFYRDYGLHGTYWHNDFGRPKSHGCVNMRTKDAKWLFEWASPSLPKGKTVVYSTAQNPGTRVVVHP